ncbi:O-methyltransferase [Planctomonas deserti]|uniref:O-methyltransferase n=1 Tax=Planctomonas deserti TaxID=2144185 RepID=UPI000D3804D2|nr:O-methyltransferase [Planctomonas deserti]
MSAVAADGRGEERSEQGTPVNRYPSEPAWRAVDEYFTEALVREDAALIAARDSGSETTMPNAEVAPNQGAFLGLLAQIAGARRVLEFGTLAGYSTLWCARAVGADGRVVTFELEETNAAVARRNLERAGVADRVDVVVGAAAASAQRLIDEGAEPFDLVFIDADKPSNPVYLAAALQLTRSGAVLVIDNVVRQGAVVRADTGDPRVEGVRRLVDDIVAHPDLDATAIQTVGIKGWDGLILARRR